MKDRVQEMENYLNSISDKIESVSEDNDNWRFLVSLIRRQEDYMQKMNKQYQQQMMYIQLVQQFIEKSELGDSLKEFLESQKKPEKEEKPEEAE